MSLLAQISADLESLVERAAPAVAGVEHRAGQGSGVVLAPDGYVLTNAHVVRGSVDLRVGLASRGEVRAALLGADERTDLAVLRVDAADLPSLPIAARPLRVGRIVVAIGNPLRFERSISLGVVSALGRAVPSRGGRLLEGLVQTDAAINPGNSGGPLVDAEGMVVGINTAIVPRAQGIGFAVPARTASWVASELIRKGEVRRPFLGIAARGEDLSPEAAREAGQIGAVRIFRVGAGTPAAAAGLLQGDVVLGVNGGAVASVDDLQRAIVLAEAREVRFDLLRGKVRREVVVRPRAQGRAA